MTVASSSSANGKALRRTVARMHAHLDTLERARRRGRVLRTAADHLFWGAVLACALLLSGYRVRVLYHPIVVVVTVCACAVVLLVYAWGRRRAPLDVALWVDEHADLDERVSSALVFLEEDDQSRMMQETVTDAERKLLGVRADQVTGPPVSRRWMAVPLLLFLLLPLAMLPPQRTAAEIAQANAMHGIRTAGGALADTVNGLQQQLGPNPTPDAAAAIQQAQEAGDALQDEGIRSREQAMERLEQAQQAVDGALREDSSRELLGDSLRRNAATRSAGEALARGDTSGAAEALRETAAGLSEDDVGGAQGQQLASDLRAAAAGLPVGAAQAAANRAAAGAEQGRLDAAQAGLRDLADETGNMSNLGDKRAQVEQAARALRQASDTVSECDGPGCAVCAGGGHGSSAAQGSESGESGAGSGGSGAGIGAGQPTIGEALSENRIPLAAAERVEVAGQLLAGERRDSEGSGGQEVGSEVSPDLTGAVREFRDLGEAEIARQDIPAGYRTLVRDYFTALEEVASGDAAQPAP